MQDLHKILDEKVNHISKVIKALPLIGTVVGVYKLMTWIIKMRRKMITK